MMDDRLEWLQTNCGKKLVELGEAVSRIRRGSRVFIGTGCGEPQALIHAMIGNMSLQDIMLYQMMSFTLARYIEEESFRKRFLIKLFFISNPMRKAAFEGWIDYIPAYLSQIPELFRSHRIGLDVALVQVSPPDRFGYCSLGVSVDITRAGMEAASMVIAQVNPLMPRTWGDSFVHVDDIDFLVWREEDLVESLPNNKHQDVFLRIGHYVSQLVDDGATIQIGFGSLPNAILECLDGKKDLGVHTQLVTDALMHLIEKKVVTNRKKTLLPGRVVASLCMGSKELYSFVNDNPIFYFRSSEFVNDPTEIARNDNLISLSSALEVDLTGQVCTDSLGFLFFSGIGDQVDFLRGSAMSRGGFSIIALPSTARNQTVSRIVPHLSEGAGVATARGDVNFVITEYGIAELHGKGIYQRVMELAQIAHPKFRESLINFARKRHYIFSDQLPPAQEDLLFLEGYKSVEKCRNGRMLEYRPLLPSDEFAFRNFFYSLRENTVYYRFFYRMRLFSHEVIQKQYADVDYRKRMSLIALRQHRGHKEIVGIGSYVPAEDAMAEVAFVVREDHQGLGIASTLLGTLEAIARENAYRGFLATVLRDNQAMIQVFKKRYPSAMIDVGSGGELTVRMTFAPERAGGPSGRSSPGA
jgi:acyl-CoA hydrolase/GNAT superfamily N-acetyltransferase